MVIVPVIRLSSIQMARPIHLDIAREQVYHSSVLVLIPIILVLGAVILGRARVNP